MKRKLNESCIKMHYGKDFLKKFFKKKRKFWKNFYKKKNLKKIP